MGKVMLADASADLAWVKFELLVPETEIWLTYRLAFTAAARAIIGSGGGYGMSVHANNTGFPSTGSQIDFVDVDNSADNWSTEWPPGNQPGSVTVDGWQQVELRHKANDANGSQLYINSSLVVDSTTIPDVLTTASVLFGFPLTFTADPDCYLYIDDVKVGTTRGASDLFADDFEDGTLDAWTATYGAVSVVDDPFPANEGINIAFTSAALEENPTWVRIDQEPYRLVTGYTINRGNDVELDKADTGTAVLRCRDLTGLLDPTNPGSPFSGLLTQQKPALIAVQHPFTLEWHSLFRGFVDRYTHDLDMFTDERGIDRVQVELFDGFGYMSRLELMPEVHGYPVSIADFPDVYYPGTPSNIADEADVFVHWDDGIVQVLDDLGWPNTGQKREGLRDVFSGNVSLQGRVVDRGDGGFAALGDIVDAEFPGGANHYISKSGVYRARGRFAFIFPENPGYGINFWNAGTATLARFDPTVAAIASLRFADGEILNSVGAWPQGVSDADVPGNLVEDATSILNYGRSGATFPDLITSAGHTDATPTNASEETRKFADFYVGNRKDSRTVVSSLTFIGRTDDDLGPAIWDLICGVEIGDVINLETTHPGGGGFDTELFVDAITHTNDVGALHVLELAVSPRPTYNPFGDIDSGVS